MALSESAVTGAAARSQLKDAIGTFAVHEAKAFGIELSQQSIAAIQASALNFSRNLTSDIEMFARHRGARTVSTADLKMALRKSEAITNSVRVAEAAFAENMMLPQTQRPAAADGSKKRGRPPKHASANAANAALPVDFAADIIGNSPSAVAGAISQSAQLNFDMLPQDSGSAPPKFKPPRSRIVRSLPSLWARHTFHTRTSGSAIACERICL
jgi:histone H3/H4